MVDRTRGPVVIVDVSGSPPGSQALRFTATLSMQTVRKAEDLRIAAARPELSASL